MHIPLWVIKYFHSKLKKEKMFSLEGKAKYFHWKLKRKIYLHWNLNKYLYWKINKTKIFSLEA